MMMNNMGGYICLSVGRVQGTWYVIQSTIIGGQAPVFYGKRLEAEEEVYLLLD